MQCDAMIYFSRWLGDHLYHEADISAERHFRLALQWDPATSMDDRHRKVTTQILQINFPKYKAL